MPHKEEPLLGEDAAMRPLRGEERRERGEERRGEERRGEERERRHIPPLHLFGFICSIDLSLTS